MTERSVLPEEAKAVDEYRSELQALCNKAQEGYDRALLTLSGGAIGLSLAFLHDIVGPLMKWPAIMMAAWICWGLSLVSVVSSYYGSAHAMRLVIKHCDDPSEGSRSGGWWGAAVPVLNWLSGLFFVIGFIAFALFILLNWSHYAG